MVPIDVLNLFVALSFILSCVSKSIITGPVVRSRTGMSCPPYGSMKSCCAATLFICSTLRSPRNFCVFKSCFILSLAPIPNIPLSKLPVDISSVTGASNLSFSPDNLYALSKNSSKPCSCIVPSNSSGIFIMLLTASLLSSAPFEASLKSAAFCIMCLCND